jgi:hypothetical protein
VLHARGLGGLDRIARQVHALWREQEQEQERLHAGKGLAQAGGIRKVSPDGREPAHDGLRLAAHHREVSTAGLQLLHEFLADGADGAHDQKGGGHVHRFQVGCDDRTLGIANHSMKASDRQTFTTAG